MNVLIRLEKLVESLIESPFDRLFKTRLHPADLAKALATAMEQGMVGDGRDGFLAPNSYRIFLNEDDFLDFQGRADVDAEAEAIRRYLTGLLTESDNRIIGEVQVLIRAKESVAPDQFEIAAEHLIPADETFETSVNTGNTRQFDINAIRPEVWQLQLPDKWVKLGMPIVRIGRASDNDVVISDPTVSRFHAQLRWRQGGYHATNLSHSQPLILNDAPVERSVLLKPGDVIKLGRIKINVGLDH